LGICFASAELVGPFPSVCAENTKLLRPKVVACITIQELSVENLMVIPVAASLLQHSIPLADVTVERRCSG
jgi:hypothetical protein